MTVDDILRIITALLSIFGAIGGIPQIIRWLRAKPHLKVNARFEKLLEENYYKLHIEVLNEKKLWKRNKDATDVMAQWYIMDKNSEHWGATYNQVISPYLGVGEKVRKGFKLFHRFDPRGNPHEIVILITCDEGVVVKEKLTHIEQTHH